MKYTVEDKMFRTILEVIIEPDDAAVDKYLDSFGYTGERTHSDSAANTYRLRFSNSSSNHTLIRLREKSVLHLAHELIHHAMITFLDKGIHVSEEEDEMLCYHVGMHMREVLAQWAKPKPIVKAKPKVKAKPIVKAK
jgi:hypothetical protein